jgi:undecaprenyl-diphosphatase
VIFHAIVLGIIQGLTEFIPVSSSGHLIVIPKLFGWQPIGNGNAFDVALHMGTLAALVWFFRRDWWGIISGFGAHILRRAPYAKDGAQATEGRFLVPIIVACIPAAVVGFLWDDFIETALRQWYWVAGGLVLFGIVMLIAERAGKKQHDMDHMNYVDYISIGCAQALALLPGVSRSGVTISAGLFRNLDRSAAARFSFLLSTPIILGAGLKKLKDLMETGIPHGEPVLMLVGFIAATISGYVAIKFLMNYLRTRTLTAFVIYRFCLAALLAVVFLLRG